jgi:uncharacterized protein YjdB
MPGYSGNIAPLLKVNTTSALYNAVSYPVGGNITTNTSATFTATVNQNSNILQVTYVTSGVIIPGMTISGLGLLEGTRITGPFNQNGPQTGNGGIGSYVMSLVANQNISGYTYTGTPATGNLLPNGPGGIVGPVPGFNCVNIQELRRYYNLPYPPATPLSSPPVIAIVSFGGGIYGQPVTSGQYAGFWKCSDVNSAGGAPVQILVAPINGAINTPNSDDGGATLENTVDVATVSAFYGMLDDRYDSPNYTPPIIILYIAPSNNLSEMYRTFYTVLKNPVICNGRSYSPTIVSCSWGAPEIAWTQKMPYPPTPSIPVDNDPDPAGIAEINEINDLFAEATKNGINICVASGDIPLDTVNSSVEMFDYAQALLVQGAGGDGYDSNQTALHQPSVFPLSDQARASLPAPEVIFPASSPYVTCVGGSAVYFPVIATGSYSNPAEFAWARGNGGISSVFSIPTYQQNLPGSASVSAAQFLATSLNTANLSETALGNPVPVIDSISGGYTAPNTAVTLAYQMKVDAYNAALKAFNEAQAALQASHYSNNNESINNALVQAVKECSTALTTAEVNKQLAEKAFHAAQEVVVRTQTVSQLLAEAGNIFGSAADSIRSLNDTQQALLDARFVAQQAAYNQLNSPTTANTIALQAANQAVQPAKAAADAAALAAVTLPASVTPTTDMANRAVSQGAAAVVALSLATHPTTTMGPTTPGAVDQPNDGQPPTSPLVPVSNLSYAIAQTVAGNLPVDPSASTAGAYLLSTLGLGYGATLVDASGNANSTIRLNLSKSVDKADLLTKILTDSTNNLTVLTDALIVQAQGQRATLLTDTGTNQYRTAIAAAFPVVAGTNGLTNTEFFAAANLAASSGAATLAGYISGANSTGTIKNLRCGVASAATALLSGLYAVTSDVVKADKDANFPFGTTDILGGTSTSGSYSGITTGLMSLRNIYANTTLATRRADTAHTAAKDVYAKFLEWSNAKDEVNNLEEKATAIYNLVPGPTSDAVTAITGELDNAKARLSAATYALGVAGEYAVITARLAQQSCAATSVLMGNTVNSSGFDQLGNIKGVDPNTWSPPVMTPSTCPVPFLIDGSGTVLAQNALNAAQSLIQAATNDNLLVNTVNTINQNTDQGVNSSGTVLTTLLGTRMLIQDAQFAAASSAARVVDVAFSDTTETLSRMMDWQGMITVANDAKLAVAAVQTLLTGVNSSGIRVDSSGTLDSSGNSTMTRAVNAVIKTVNGIIAITTPYNQQSTPSATIATNSVVALAGFLEHTKNVCLAAQTAIQLAASTYSVNSSGTFISGNTSAPGGSIFTVNLAYAKVCVNAMSAACTGSAILLREKAVLAAKRANYSALALRKLVGNDNISEAIAGFLDASGNLVNATGHDSTSPLGTAANGLKPPAVTADTVLYQGRGGVAGNIYQGELGQIMPATTNLTYTIDGSSNTVYQAVLNFSTKAQGVLDALGTDSSGNQLTMSYLKYPNVNAVNALNSSGCLTTVLAAQNALLAAYEAQQWVVSSANASFVTFGYTNFSQNLITFTPTISGIMSKLSSDADKVLNTVQKAEGAILYALQLRPKRVQYHDLDAANFAVAINANQSAIDTYLALRKSAIQHQVDTIDAFHLGDITNALSPIVANATTAAGQASALGAMSWNSRAPNPNFASNNSLVRANFPPGGWGSAGAGAPSLWPPSGPPGTWTGRQFYPIQDPSNPNYGPFNGTDSSFNPAPYPIPTPMASALSSRPVAPDADVLQYSANLFAYYTSNAALATASYAKKSADSAADFTKLMVSVSTVTPSLLDAATSAADLTLRCAQDMNAATGGDIDMFVGPTGNISWPSQTNQVAFLLNQEFKAILAAQDSASKNLDETSPNLTNNYPNPNLYLSRLNMLNLWNDAVDAAKAVVQAMADGEANGIDYDSLGDVSLLGKFEGDGNQSAQANFDLPNQGIPLGSPATYNGAPIGIRSTYGTLLGNLNRAVINAYNATTGSPDGSGNRRYKQFYYPEGTSTLVTNVPENVNDTNQAYNNAVAVFNANYTVPNAPFAAARAAWIAISNAQVAANAAASTPPTSVDSSNTYYLAANTSLLTGTPVNLITALDASGNETIAQTQVALTYWNTALTRAANMINNPDGSDVTLASIFELMSLVGINFPNAIPAQEVSSDISNANAINTFQSYIMNLWSQGKSTLWTDTSGNQYLPTTNSSGITYSLSDSSGFGAFLALNSSGYAGADYLSWGRASGNIVYNGNTRATPSGSPGNYWSAYYWTQATQKQNTVAYQTAYTAWQAVLTLLTTYANWRDSLNTNMMRTNVTKGRALYSVKISLQAARRASEAGNASATAAAELAAATNCYEDLAASAAAEAAYATTVNLKMYRCIPDIAMHANADDLPVIFKLNGGTVYVGGTSVAAAMFAGFLGVVQSHTPISYFVNPLLYDNYTAPSPLFYDISGSLQVWYPGALSIPGPIGGSTVPPRIANILPGTQNPTSGLGSGIYNCNVGLGSIKAANLAALMEVPHLVDRIDPQNGVGQVTVYPGTSATITVYVEPVDAYNPFVTWSCNTSNATVTQTNGPIISNNGVNDTQPYTQYDPLKFDSSGNQIPVSSSVGNYALASVGNIAKGTNPFHLDSSGFQVPCLIFSATVTGVMAVPTSQPPPVITVSTTDGSRTFGEFTVSVLPAVQVTGVSISAENETQNPSNSTLYLGKTLQLIANVTPNNATNKKVVWWSSNTSIVTIDVNGLMTSLAPGKVTIKATSMNNGISASISVYVPTPITGIKILPSVLTLNPNMALFPLNNTGLIKVLVEPPEADYKNLTWEILSNRQLEPAPTGITDVISLPRNGNVLERNAAGDIINNTEATITAISNGSAVIKVSTSGEPYGVYGTYTATATVNVVTSITNIVMQEASMVVKLNPETTTNPNLPESYKVTATLKPAFPSNMNVYWSSSNPRVAVVSNNSPPKLNTVSSDPNFGFWQITEIITPLSNGNTVIKVVTEDGQQSATTTVSVTTPVSGLAMSALPIVLNPSRQYTIQATVLPQNATNKTVLWSSTNSSIATVDSNGTVKAISTGSCGIIATTEDGDYSAITEISVVTPLVGVQLMVNTPLPIHIGNEVQIMVVMVPTTASNQSFTWTVADGPQGAIFTAGQPQNGNIVFLDAFQAGSAVFTVTTADGNKQASINLQVLPW